MGIFRIIILGLMIYVVVSTILTAIDGNVSLFSSLMLGNALLLESLLASAIKGVNFIVLEILLMYISLVGFSFVLKKVSANIEKKKEKFFTGFGKSFVDGILLLLGGMILGMILFFLLIVLNIIVFIPILNIILLPIVILLPVWILLLFSLFIGTIVFQRDFQEGLNRSLTLPFKKPILFLYAFVFLLIFVIMYFVLIGIVGLFALIPTIGVFISIISCFFLMPFLEIFLSGFIYCLSKE